jgi:hypothetical protein
MAIRVLFEINLFGCQRSKLYYFLATGFGSSALPICQFGGKYPGRVHAFLTRREQCDLSRLT